jgi:transcriptional regulator with XRE-family HTH domain
MAKASRQITDADRAAAANLRELWTAHKHAHNIRQSDVAEALSISESAVTQYLRGDLPLGVKATLRWARYLNVAPSAIRPDFEELAGMSPPRVNEALLREAILRIDKFLVEVGDALPIDQRADLIAAVYKEALAEGEVDDRMVRYMYRFATLAR